MDKKLNGIIADMVKTAKTHDEKMARLVVKALELTTQSELVKLLGKKGFKTSQTQISRWNSIGKALATNPELDAEKVAKDLRQNKAKVSDVAKGQTRKAQGKTNQTSKFDSVKKSLKSAIKDSKTLTESEKAKLRDLTLELVSVLGVIPSADTLLTEFDAIMAELGQAHRKDPTREIGWGFFIAFYSNQNNCGMWADESGICGQVLMYVNKCQLDITLKVWHDCIMTRTYLVRCLF